MESTKLQRKFTMRLRLTTLCAVFRFIALNYHRRCTRSGRTLQNCKATEYMENTFFIFMQYFMQYIQITSYTYSNMNIQLNYIASLTFSCSLVGQYIPVTNGKLISWLRGLNL